MSKSKDMLLLAAGLTLCFSIAEATATKRANLPQPVYSIGTVFIYSNGAVEKLINKGNNEFIIEDMRKRLYKRDLNFTITNLEYTSLYSGYQQTILSGTPDSIFPLTNSRDSSFVLLRKKGNGKKLQRSWACRPATEKKIKILGDSIPVFKVSCSRNAWKRYLVTKEEIDYYYDPKTAWVVKTVKRKKGKKRTKKLVAVLSPEKVSAKAITRIVKKLKH